MRWTNFPLEPVGWSEGLDLTDRSLLAVPPNRKKLWHTAESAQRAAKGNCR